MSQSSVRVRIAPSPTGKIHVGTIRTALFNYLYARKHKGSFVVRIEDTDQERSKKEHENLIFEGLRWAGLDWDEGPDIGGSFGPYRQMERLHHYQQYAKQLIEGNKAYYCYCTQEELAEERKRQQAAKQPPKYSGRCADLSEDQKKQFEDEGRKPVLRFRLPSEKITLVDIIRGNVDFDTSLQSDPIIMKANNTPMFNFANVIDDHLMQISHVIRGEEFIPSMPQQILLHKALGFPLPQYAHIPLILNPDRTKMSKRRNEGVLEPYVEKGYLPEAMINFLVLLGWSPGTDQEIFTMDQLIEAFSLEGIQPSPATLQEQKLNWFNGQYIRQFSLEQLKEKVKPFIPDAWFQDQAKLDTILPLVHERLVTFSEVKEQIAFVFEDISIDKELLENKKKTFEETADMFAKLLLKLENTSWEEESIEKTLRAFCEEIDWKIGAVFMPVRLAATGSKATPPLFATLAVLGKDLVSQTNKKYHCYITVMQLFTLNFIL